LYYYVSIKDDLEVIEKLSALAEKKPMEGQDKFYNRIRNEGILWNHKRVERVYRLMGLNKRRRTKKRVPARIKEPLVVPIHLPLVSGFSLDWINFINKNTDF
jgi:putative transposase